MKHLIQTKRSAISAFFMLALLFMPAFVRAQTVKIVAQPLRVTVPINAAVSNNISFVITESGTALTPIHLTLNPALPAGASYLLSTNDFFTNCAGILTIFTTNVAEGVYALTLDASGGAVRTLPLTLQVAHVWSASDATNGISTNWESVGNWANAQVPNASSDVVFNDAGGLASGVTTTNVAVDVNTEVASLRFSETNGASRRFNVAINPGVQLKITGTNGFSLLTDRSDAAGAPFNIFFSGADGSFIVTNPAASIEAFAAPNSANLFDFSSLGTWIVNVSKIGVSDYQAYPGYTNLLNNSYPGSTATLRQMEAQLRFARTNFITANLPADTNNWLDTAFRSYALVYGRNDSSGNGTRGNLYFGISNVFNLDSACFFGAGVVGEQAANNMFNPAFINSNCVAIFRGTNGGRMSMFAIADGAGNSASGSGTKGQLNFTGGRVDALVDRLYLARERTNSTGANVQGLLTITAGIFDVNTAIIGYQGQNTNLVVWTGAANCQGTLNVSTSAVFRVNSTMILGYTTWPTPGAPASIETGFGQVNVNGGGTVLANTITVGGDSKISVNNNIAITAGSSLVISNTLADPVKPLNSLTISGGSTLTLHVDGSKNTPYVYVSTLSVPVAQGNMLQIGAVKNLSALQVPLISYGSGSASFAGVNMPAGLHGSLINNGPNELDLLITPSTNNLVWRGYSSANWNLSDVNWLDVATGLHTNFQTGDSVTFDDAAGVPTTINISDPVVVPTQVTMNNTANYYTFNGSGALQGGAVLTKTGTNVVEIDATTTITVQVNQGSLLGNSSGQVGAVGVATGASMNFAGTILSGVTCAGTATISGSGNGTLTMQSGGVLSQLGTFNGTFTLANGSALLNSGTFNNMGSPTVSSNTVFINSGNLNGSALTVDTGGLYKDSGAGISTFTGVITINGTGTFVVGNADGHSQVEYDGSGGISFPQRARVLLSNGSTNIFGVNADNATANTLLSRSVDFGNNNTLSGGGGVIVITNVGVAPLAAGQSYQLFENSGDTHLYEAGTNTAPVISPGAPGPGLAWDTRTLRNDGFIKIIAVSTNPPTLPIMPFITNNLVLLTSIVTNTTTLVVTTNYSTNRAVIINFNWPSTNVGWRLQQQISTAEQGIRAGNSNWTYVYPSWWTNQISVTNTFVTNAADFYRMIYP